MSWNGVIGLEGGGLCARVLKEGMHDSRRRKGEGEVCILRLDLRLFRLSYLLVLWGVLVLHSYGGREEHAGKLFVSMSCRLVSVKTVGLPPASTCCRGVKRTFAQSLLHDLGSEVPVRLYLQNEATNERQPRCIPPSESVLLPPKYLRVSLSITWPHRAPRIQHVRSCSRTFFAFATCHHSLSRLRQPPSPAPRRYPCPWSGPQSAR
jgi:hypothetical protein